MIALLQRVSSAEVWVGGAQVAAIDEGLLALVGVRGDDGEADAERVLQYRMFSDGEGRMNRSVMEVGGGVLAVPQFTLSADTRQGNRPGFSTAAHPDTARALFDHFVQSARAHHPDI